MREASNGIRDERTAPRRGLARKALFFASLALMYVLLAAPKDDCGACRLFEEGYIAYLSGNDCQKLGEKQRKKGNSEKSTEYRKNAAKNWRSAADSFYSAIQLRSPDGKRIYFEKYPQIEEPYIPRYYLGLSLYQLGCYREAFGHFDKSHVPQMSGRQVEKSELSRLKGECDENISRHMRPKDPNEDCSRWLP